MDNIYDRPLDKEHFDPERSQEKILMQIKPGSTVLECGCATGYMTGYMRNELQCSVRKGLQRGTLGAERIAMLDEIGMLWTVREKDRWTEYYTAAKAYSCEFGHLCVPYAYITPDGVKLGQWLATLKTQRNRRGKGRYLTPERIAALGLV